MTCDEAGKYGGPMNEGPVVRREEAGGRGAQCNDDGKTENPLLRTTVRNVLVQQGCTEDGERTEDHEAAFITSCIGEHESTLHVVTPSELMESRAKLYGVFHAPAVKISTSR